MSKMPFEDAFTTLVKPLRDPYLIFGLAAGIIVVGALTITGNVALVVIVAAVLIVALAARLVANVQSQRGGNSISTSVNARGAVITGGSEVGNIHTSGAGSITSTANVSHARIENSKVASVENQEQPVQGEADNHGDDSPHGG
jgi:hypothetical protein